MDKKEILEEILKRGFRITPQALSLVRGRDELNKLTNYLDALCAAPAAISEEIVVDALDFGLEEVEQGTATPAGERATVTVADVINYNNKRYEILKKILIENTPASPLSINKLGKLAPGEKNFSLIAMVAGVDRDRKTISVEDTTGELEIIAPESILEEILEDDVLLFECAKDDGGAKATGAKWPDIPLKREVNRATEDVKCAFFGIGEGEDADQQQIASMITDLLGGNLYVFVFVFNNFREGASGEEKIAGLVRQLQNRGIKKIILVSNQAFKSLPSVVCLKPPVAVRMHGIRILVGGGEMEKYKTMLGGDAGESLMLRMLKRRDLNPVFSSEELASESASGGRVAGFVVENVPDFFVSSSAGAPGSANYKGTTIISTGVQGVLWVAGLSTREVNKFNLQ